MNKLCPEAVHPRDPAEGARSHDQYDHQVSELWFFLVLLVLPMNDRDYKQVMLKCVDQSVCESSTRGT